MVSAIHTFAVASLIVPILYFSFYLTQENLPVRYWKSLLQKLKVRTVSDEACGEMLSHLLLDEDEFKIYNASILNFGSSIVDHSLCAGPLPHQDACQGDSGGPLVFEDPLKVLLPTVMSIAGFFFVHFFGYGQFVISRKPEFLYF